MALVATLVPSSALAKTPPPVVTAGISYGTGPSETLDAYPATNPNSPVIIAVHGGAWKSGSSADVAKICDNVQLKGWACFAINYALAPTYVWPTQMTNMQDALTWVQQNAANYNGDPSRLAFWGVSAGGHLSLMAAYALPGVKAVVSWSGPTDLGAMVESRNDALGLMGCPRKGCSDPNLMPSASPVTYAASTSPATLLAHSQSDRTVDFFESQELDTDLTNLGQPDHTFLQYPGSAHALALWAQAWTPTYNWLLAHL